MLRDIIFEEYEKIDDEVVKRKQEICYIAGLAQKNYDKLVEITGSDNDRELFESVKRALRDVVDNDPCIGLTFYAEDEALKEAVSLGWMGRTDNTHIMLSVTKLGRKVVDDYKRFKELIGAE